MRGYAAASLVVIGLYALLPGGWGGINQLLVFVGAAACVAYGRHKVEHGHRGPWTLLLWSLAAFVAANLVLLLPGDRAATYGRLIDTTGYLLLLAGALAFIVRPG